MTTIIDTAKAAMPIAAPLLAALSTLWSMARSGRKCARIRRDLKENLELAKLAHEANAESTEKTLYELTTTQATALADADQEARTRKRDTASLTAVIVLLVIGGGLCGFFWWLDWVVTDVLFWLVVIFLAVFVPFGIVNWLTGGKAGAKSEG